MSAVAQPRVLAGTALYEIERLLPGVEAAWLEHHALLPVRRERERLVTATWRDDVDPQALDDLRCLTNLEPELWACGEDDVRRAIQRVYGEQATSAQALIAGLDPGSGIGVEGELALDDLVSLANEAPVVRLVNLLLLEALEARASDVHLEAYAQSLRVRYRVDGILRDAPAPPPQWMPAVISRLKIMAELDIAERRLPQDGRIRLRLQDRQVDVRVSTLPTLHGESVVLRLLDTDARRVSLDQLGLAPDTLRALRDAIGRPHGVVLATGPTGSGKTTTLYAAVEAIRTGREKILTVEDPVEYELAGVPQVPVNERVGVTFATALRALLRQDPDVILVGEIRDPETAEIATQAALTGHLVLSTLHTNDAASALTRLLDLGVAPFLVASTVEAVLAQRLVRTVCAACTAPDETDAPWAAAGTAAGRRRGTGCPECGGTGYRGRTGVYELLVMNDALRREVLQRGASSELRRIAAESGMRTLHDDGLRQVAAGVTTMEEVWRVTRG